MGLLSDIGDALGGVVGGIGDAVGDVFGSLTGADAADAARDAANVQMQAGRQASSLLNPFQQLGQSGLDQAGFLTDPNQQFQFLQSNPLFQMGLDNLNTQTQKNAAATGRLSATDTSQQFMNNSLLAASPLISGQQDQINNLLTMGLNVAGNQGNLMTGVGAAQAGGIIGASNAKQTGIGNLLQLGGLALGGMGMLGGAGAAAGVGAGAAAGAGAGIGAGMAGAFSDVELKENITKIGTENGYNKYSWDWNSKAKVELGLSGGATGVLAQEVELKSPNAVYVENGRKKVNYEMIGVSHND